MSSFLRVEEPSDESNLSSGWQLVCDEDGASSTVVGGDSKLQQVQQKSAIKFGMQHLSRRDSIVHVAVVVSAAVIPSVAASMPGIGVAASAFLASPMVQASIVQCAAFVHLVTTQL